MRTYRTLLGDEKLAKLVKVNGSTGLAQELKPSGIFKGVVEATDDETGKTTYYLAIADETNTTRIYTTGVKREVDRLIEATTELGEYITIACTMQTSRKTGQKYFKIEVVSI